MLAVAATRRPFLRSAIGVLRTSGRGIAGYRGTVSGPPRVRISFAEKVTHGVIIFVGCTITPLYVSLKFKEYNKKDESED